MTSLIYPRKLGGSVTVHIPDVVDVVVDDGERTRNETETEWEHRKPHPFSKKSNSSDTLLPKTPSSVARSSKNGNKVDKVKNWIDKKTIQELQEKADQESLATKKLYTSLLDTEKTFVKKLGDLLSHKELVDLRKKEILYLKWSEEVYEPIRKKILEAIDGADWIHLDRRKREMHRQFLEHVNKRGYVFLDDDDREQYYAQALNGHRPAPIKIKTGVLRDPLLTLGRKQAEEERAILRCMTGHKYSDKDIEMVKLPTLPLVPQGRHGVDSRKWLQMPLNNIESAPREKSRNRMWGLSTKSTIDFKAWAKAQFDAEIAEQELGIPKRKTYAEKPPFGKTTVEIPRAPFIDPEDFSDKIINTNPFPEHMARLRQEMEEMKAYYDYQLEQQRLFMDEDDFMALQRTHQAFQQPPTQSKLDNDEAITLLA
ncbi:protein FAM228B-like isoform X1 [Biomphalaria glabrata]|uniref:Protein FAM228B-like isoform X1 n=1 Tax=Biomphalaria glabrata TaxID=6526 RepID=A0A9U8E721_BIOGL|nr:protein FAM228B-like isoform X1 [Biomphalaria glabrata]